MKKTYNAPCMKVATLNVTELVCQSPYSGGTVPTSDDVPGEQAVNMNSRENNSLWDAEW